jgi:biotin operon repressor
VQPPLSFPLPVYRDRPSVVPHEGGRIYISVHDAEYLRLRAEWKQKLADEHPDRTGRSFAFRKLIKQREAWEASEAKWYAQHGLTPPNPPKVLPEPPTTRDVWVPYPGTGQTYRDVVAHLQQHPNASNRAIADVLGVSTGAVYMARKRMTARQSRPLTPMQRLVVYLSHQQPVTTEQAAGAIGTTPGHIRVMVLRLRRQGYEILRVTRHGQPDTYRLLVTESHR